MNQHFGSLVLGLAAQASAALDGQLPPGAEEAGAATRGGWRRLSSTRWPRCRRRPAAIWMPTKCQLLDQALTSLRFRFATGKPA